MHMTDKISLLITDDHGLVRQGTRAFLELQPDITVIGEAGSGEEAVRMAAEAGTRCGANGPCHARDRWRRGHAAGEAGQPALTGHRANFVSRR